MKVIAGETAGWLNAEVWLDGEKLPYCLEADDQEGWAKCARTEQTDSGRVRLACNEHNEVIEEIYRGQVEIRGMPEAKEA